MSLSLTEVFMLLGMLGGWVGSIVGVGAWALGKVEAAEKRLDDRVDDCHSRINDSRAEMIGKEELTRVVQMFTDAVQEMRTDIRALHARIDKVLERPAPPAG